MTWADFLIAVRAELPVDNERLGIATGVPNFLDQQILHCVIDLQKAIPFYRYGHETIYGPDDLIMNGLASIGSLPVTEQGHPQEAFYKKTGTQCVSQPLWQYDWGNRYDLVCGNPKVVNCQFFMAIDPQGKQFMVFPSVGTQHQISLFWEGVKTSFDSADTVPFDDDVAELVGLFVKSRISRLVDHDIPEATSFWTDYRTRKSLLYADCRERNRLNRNEPSQSRASRCSNAVSVCTDTGSGIIGVDVEHEDTTEFCVFGDTGTTAEIANSSAVANLVKSLEPDFVMHLGDAVMPHGEPVYIQDTLLKNYGLYIPETFLLAYGNHDIETDAGVALGELLTKQAALNQGYTYYDFVPRGTAAESMVPPDQSEDIVHVFVLDTNGDVAEQAAWLQPLLEASTLWNVVVMHESPYTSDVLHYPGSMAWRLPYKTWGADLVISAHGHNYERLLVDGLPYIVSGLGGSGKRAFFATPLGESQFRYNTFYGCAYVTARDERLQVTFYDTRGVLIDSLALEREVA